jgi:hypothetical protein
MPSAASCRNFVNIRLFLGWLWNVLQFNKKVERFIAQRAAEGLEP